MWSSSTFQPSGAHNAKTEERKFNQAGWNVGAESFDDLDNILWEPGLLTWLMPRPISLIHTAIRDTQRRDCGSKVSVPVWCCPACVSDAKYDFSETRPGWTRIKKFRVWNPRIGSSIVRLRLCLQVRLKLTFSLEYDMNCWLFFYERSNLQLLSCAVLNLCISFCGNVGALLYRIFYWHSHFTRW